MSSWWEDLGESIKQIGGGALAAVGAIGDFILWPIAQATGDEELGASIENRRANPGIDSFGYTPGDAFAGSAALMGMQVGVPKDWTQTAVSATGTALAYPADWTSDLIASTALVVSGQAGSWDQAFQATNFGGDINAPGQVSPGQAITSGLFGKNILKKDDLAQLQGDAAFNFASGLFDLANTIFLDPLAVGGKVSKLLRLAALTKPITAESKLVSGTQKIIGAGYKGATHAERVTSYLDSSAWNKLWKWKQGKTIDQIAELMPNNEYRTEVAAAIHLAQSKAEMDEVGRIALGDDKAWESLSKSNEQLALGIQQAMIKKSALLRGAKSPQHKAYLDILDRQISTATDLQEWNDRLLNLGYSSSLQMNPIGGARVFGRDIGTGRAFKAAEKRAERNLQSQHSPFSYKSFKAGGPLGPVVQVARLSRKGTMPTGWLNLNEADSHVELRNMLNLTPLGDNVKADLVQKYELAFTPGMRQAAEATATRRAIESIAIKHGYKPDAVNGIVTEYLKRRGEAAKSLQGRAYSSAQRGGQTVDILDVDGTPVRLPIHPSQLANVIHLPDVVELDRILGRESTKNIVKAAGNFGVDLTEALGEAMTGFWKTSVLLRLGYPLRVLTDDQARILSYLGGLAFGEMWTKRTASVFRNSFKATADLAHGRRPTWQHFGQGQLKTTNFFGQGSLKALDRKLEDAFGSADRTNIYFGQSGSGDNWRRDIQVKGLQLYKNMKASGNWVDIIPTDQNIPEHLDAWYKAIVNHQIENPLAKRILGGLDDARLIQWLKSPHKDAVKLRREVPYFAADPKDWISRIRHDLDNTLPNQEIRNLALSGKLRREDLEAIPLQDRPIVNGPQIEHNTGRGFLNRTYTAAMERIFKVLGEMPTDALSRHPLFVMLYRDRVKSLAKNALEAYGAADAIPQEVISRMEIASRNHALRTVKDVLFDISSRSNTAHVLRFVSPFFSAWQDSMTTWLGLAKRDPSLFPRSVAIWNAPNQVDMYQRDDQGRIIKDDFGQPQMRNYWGWSFEVTDKDGNPIMDKHNIWFMDPEQQIRIQVPEFLAQSMGGASTVDISKGSLFSIAQGETPWMPGGGPFINIAAGEILKAKPEWEGALKWILPYGAPPSMLDNVIPASFKNGWRAVFGDADDQVFAQTQFMIMQSELVKYFNNERRTPPKWDEISDRASRYYKLKAFSSFLLPFTPAYKSPYQWYIDQYHKMQRGIDMADPTQNPDQLFYDRFGDTYYVLSKSLDKNNTGIPATKGALALTKKYSDVIAEDPEMGRLIIGPVGDSDFSTSIYRWQFDNEVIPGSGVHFREKMKPFDAIQEAQVSLGWMKYRSVINGLLAIMQPMGYQDFNDPGAEQFKEYKSLITEALAQDNPAWRDAFTLHDDDKMLRRIETFKKWVNEPRFKNDSQRQDMKGLADYLTVRDQFVNALKSRGQVDEITGKLKKTSLDAEKNADLKQAWDSVKAQLIGANTRFSDLYYTYLEFDNLQY